MKTNMKNLKNILTILFLAVLCACNSDDDNNPNDNNNYFEFEFLKVGNKWEYEISYYDTNGTFISKNDITYEITAIKKYEGDAGWDNEFIINEGNSDSFYENINSLYCEPFWGDENSGFPTIYKNYYKGQKWKWHNEIYNYDWLREVLSTNETVTIPAGTFYNCIKIRQNNDEKSIYYVSRKYGLIMLESDIYYTDDNGFVELRKCIRKLKSKNF